jgi:hypothetical protein
VLVDIDCEIRAETVAAYRIHDGKTTDWVPKSQVEWNEEDGIMTMPLWLATEKGFT